MMAATSAMMASAHTTSMSVKPPSLALRSARPAGDVGGCAGAAFIAVRAIGHDVISAVLSGRTIDVRLSPRVIRHAAALEIGAVPGRNVAGRADQRHQAFRGGRIAAGVEVEQVERAREALDLDLGGLDLRFAEIIEHARADQADDKRDDGEHNKA